MFWNRNVRACIHLSHKYGCVCVCAGMWCLAWETQQGFCSVALQSDGGGSEGGQAVITNSIHFRNNNTALRVNRGLFSPGSHWSARAKNSTHLLSLAVTSQDGALARPPTGSLIFSFALCTQKDPPVCAHAHIARELYSLCSAGELTHKQRNAEFKLLEYNYINILFFVCPSLNTYKFSFLLQVTKMYFLV